MANDKKQPETRYRNWATVIYPESVTPDWIQKLDDLKIPVFISPLHDRDTNPTGEPKKAHYHVMMMFEGKKSRSQVQDLVDAFGGVGAEKINSIRGYARYLCHLDNPEKAQYNIDDVVALYGADYKHTIGLPSDKYKAIREMMDWIDTNHCYVYAELLNWSAINRPDWFTSLCDNSTMVIKEYMKSRQWQVDKQTK